MSIVRFDIGRRIIYNDTPYVIKGYASFSEVLAKEVHPPYKEKIIKINEIIKDPKNITASKKTLVDISDTEFSEAKERYLIIKPLLELEKRTTKDVQKIAKQHKKSPATLYRWIKKFEAYGTITALANSFDNCGAKGKGRLDPSIEAIIQSVIDELYLNKQQYSLSYIHLKIQNKCQNAGLKAPTLNTVRNRIAQLSPKLVAKNRKGLSVRDTRGTPGKFPDVHMPLDVIQIDHTPMDVIIVDEESRQEIGRPYITLAIDVYSRMIFGFYISLEAPSYFSVGQTLLNAILPKDDLLQYHNIQGEWPVYGLPRAIHMDNAAEFRSESLKRFAEEYRITHILRPVARPEFGGHVESAIKTAMGKVHQLPGSTFSNINEKGTYNSQKEASLTLKELEQWFLEFIVNIYHKSVHSSIGMTPEEKFYQGMLGVEDGAIPFLPTVPANTLKLRMALLPAMERTVQKNGITIDHITYFSETLRKWIIPVSYKKITKNIHPKKVLCRRDPRDISKIYVFDDDVNDYIIVPYADIKRPAINLKELRRAISEAKKAVTGRGIESHDIFEAHERLYQYAQKSKREQKSVRRAKSSKKHMKRTIEFEKKQIPEVAKNTAQNHTIIENDDSDFEYYPVD
ncbi:Mu transposase C-terminal domain-containing protein [Sulfurimonas paralvinellae]|uniref:DDE-type integrase/transposase/recombinase n=1 Tax=Sulfurimonas paralvinellae TaxID=317658 RepID=A0A7M1B9W7_9BACT|nr:Mu transposase C-terminal domain-containing protein [Sulfurimonas paralvinellae]QOP46455.1 DDE-type integrase/transposase/recombinase [Sulfurimonas paralvinellae]